MLSNCSLKLFFRTVIASIFLISLCAAPSFSQGSYTAQLRGTVMDQSKAQVPKATVTITNVSTNIPVSTTTDDNGQYIFNGLRPAVYSVKVEATGFESIVQNNVVLAVSQQSTLDFSLKLGSISANIEVNDTAPLLDTGGAALGTEVTNEFISRMPLAGRDTTQLVYLSAGVTKLNNASGYPTGTDFSSNGQRYGTAEFRLDGVLATGPEQGEGATTNLSYNPSAEIVQEFKVQNNSFSAEYGNNGGTIINVLLKSGSNQFHGSGWWFLARPELDANSFFNNKNGLPKSDYAHDQYGFSLSGPIKKEKTFFLVDLELQRNKNAGSADARVPTDLERKGDFSQTIVSDDNGNPAPVKLYNPLLPLDINGQRQLIPSSVIPEGMKDLVGKALVNAYPLATGPVDPSTQTNFHKNLISTNPTRQFDIKIDHQLTATTHLAGRYSQNHNPSVTPRVFFDGEHSIVETRNVGLEYAWTVNSHLLWTNRLGLDRIYQLSTSDHVDPTQFGLPALLTQANNIVRMPTVNVDNYNQLNPECCRDTTLGHTQYNFSSSLNWVTGRHVFKFGGEQRLFFNDFYQPDNATGLFNFSRITTSQDPTGSTPAGNSTPAEQGTGLASLFFGFMSQSSLNIKRPVEEKSKETAFYIQDDWKLTPRLTINLGLRYEWSTPYNERHNQLQFSDFKGDSGITVDLTIPKTDQNGAPVPDLSSLGLGPTRLKGITLFPTPGRRNVPVDRNNIGPRFGFAYQVMPSTVLRGGAGIFYGLAVATNFQYAGNAFVKTAQIHGSVNDAGVTQFATLANPFPTLPAGQLPQIQGTKYGPLANWGFDDGNDLGTETARNAEIYQWNLGLQHLFPFGVVISADYSASRGTHLPWAGTRNHNVMSTAARTACNSNCQNLQVANPFKSLFVGPAAIFNEPDSLYNSDFISLGNLLHPYPQFNGGFTGLPSLAASSWYNGMLVRFQKRPSHGLSFEGNYTLAKATDTSSYGANNFIFFNGNGLGFPQDLNNLPAERSVAANDNRHRFVIATVYDLPLGRGRWVGRGMNRVLDAIAGGWSFSTLITVQSGQPIPFGLNSPLFTDGTQRPNIICSHPASGLSLHDVVSTPGASYYNQSCFADPGDQVPGNAPRFSSNVRGPAIHQTDIGFLKAFTVREGMKLEVRAEFFNFTNTPRFATPDSFLHSLTFGQVTGEAPGSGPRNMQIGVRFEF